MTNWRTYGSPTEHEWRAIVEQAGGPPELAGVAAWSAAKEHGWLILAIGMRESKLGTAFNKMPSGNKNPFGLRPRGKDGYQKFDSWVDAVAELHDRITDPDYAYAPTETLAELIAVYSPDSDNNPGQEAEYVASILSNFAKWGVTPKGEPMADLVYGTTPYPAVIASHLPASNPYVQESGAPKDSDVQGVFWHIMVGSWEGTNNWFHAGKAATAYGVSTQHTDGAGGKIYEWIPRDTGWYGESSGPAVAPYGDGAKLIEAVGVNSVNRTTKAIEISGTPDTPLDEAARNAIVNLTAFFADQARIPWDVFPIIPGTDRSFVLYHNEITGMAYKTCPGRVVMSETSALIQRITAVLKHYQTKGGAAPKPPAYAAPDLPEWWDDSIEQSYPGDNSHKGKKYYVARRNYVAIKGTRRMAGPASDSGRSGPNVQVREKIHGERIIDNKWVLTIEGHHVACSSLSPRLTVKPGS